MPKGSRGGSGRYNGGSMNPNDIVSTSDMVSARHGANGKYADEVLEMARDVRAKYGVEVEQLQIAKLQGKSKNGVLGFYDGANIAVNEHYFNKNMQTAYDESVKQGFHPSRGNKTAMQAVMSHEMGHYINGEIANRMGMDFNSAATHIVNEARKATGHRGVVKMAGKISGYATSSNAETIAEAFSDVYCNGKNAKRESQAIMKVVDSYFKKGGKK